MSPEPKVFRSRVDLWLALVLVAPLLLTGSLVFGLYRQGDGNVTVPLAVFAVTVIAIGWFLADTSYTVDGDTLRIHGGPLRWRVAIPGIRRIRRSRSVLSAPALSLTRLEIEHGAGTLLISPKDEAAFLALIAARVPGVRIEPGLLTGA